MIISLIGPHAIGKTTAIKRWSAMYPWAKVVMCDQGLAFNAEGWEEKQRGWLGSSDEKVACAVRAAYDPDLWICEGNTARNMPWMKVIKSQLLIHVFCSPEKFRELMRTRCEAKNKKFREDYWDDKKLEYESAGRFRNALKAGRILASSVVEVEINDQAKDWLIVDQIIVDTLSRVHL